MTRTKLDPDLLTKMAAKTGKKKQYLREQISRRATRSGVTSLAAQVLWAKALGFGVTSVLNHADPSVREEVRHGGSQQPGNRPTSALPKGSGQKKEQPVTRATIDFLLQDSELRGRCKDLLLAGRHFDRVFREATTVLDDRLKTTSGIPHMNPAALVAKTLNPDPTKAVIVISTDKNEQQGFFSICNGVVLTFRNKTHHTLNSTFTQADALKFCAFIDALLTVIGKGVVHPERI